MEQIVIIKQDGTRVPINRKGTARAVTSAEQTWTINADDTLSITIKSVEPQEFNVGDRVKVFGRWYTLNRLPKVKKTGAHTFEYTLGFEGVQYDLMSATYDVNIDTTGNELQDVWGDSLTGNLKRFMDVLVSNANRLFPGKWRVGSVIDTDGDVTLTFGESDNCLSVLQTLCNKFECEFEIVTSDDDVNTINMVTQVGKTLPYTFQYGLGRGLYELQRDNVTSSNIVTRLKVYGSDENITSKYRADRLCLPNCTKSQSIIEDARMVAQYGIYEGKKYFDIKPTFTGKVDAIVEGDVVSFVDNSIDFDLNAKDKDGETIYLVSGQAAKVHFNTGNLAGYEFDVSSYNHGTHTIKLKRNTDDRGMVFPSDTAKAFRFAKGDEYKLLNITMPDSLITEAENKLADTAKEYYEQNCQPKVQYSLTLEKIFVERTFGSQAGTTNVFAPGDYIRVVDTDIAVDKAMRVKSIKRNVLDDYDYTLTISDTTDTTSITSRVISELDEIEKVIVVNKLNDVARAKRNWQASREVLDMVFDADGNYYTDKIAPLSIDTTMLAVGARSAQFTYDGQFMPNYGKDANAFAWSDATLTHFAIEDETKMWGITGSEITDLPSAALYLYAVCERGTTDASIKLTQEQIKVDADATHYTFLVGILSSPIKGDDNRTIRILSLTYGSTTINGRTIQTGVIRSSGGGAAYFDLDNGEIGGTIKFRDSSGTYKDVADVATTANTARDYINNTLPGVLDDMRKQIDGQIEQWFYDVNPKPTSPEEYNDGAPNDEWVKKGTQADHVGDLYYNTESGKVWRYIKGYDVQPDDVVEVYYWSQLSDEDTSKALETANDALALARKKRRIFTERPYPPYDVGDLWVQGEDGDIMRCVTERTSGNYAATDWERASKYTDDSALDTFVNNTYQDDLDDVKSQVDGKIEMWFQSSDPAASWTTMMVKSKHVGDMWYNTEKKTLQSYRQQVVQQKTAFVWVTIQDADAIAAMEAASNAQDTADGKRQVFVKTPSVPYDVGDLWVDGTDLRTCVTAKTSAETYNINDWDIKVGYDNTQTTIDGGLVTSGTIQVAGDNTNILAGITGKDTATDSVRFWAGASQENRYTAPFRVLQDGTMYATKANISGVINANTGKIGGFNLSYGCIGTETTGGATSGSNLTLMNDFVKFANTYTWASIGTNVLPSSTGLVGVGRFTNKTPNAYGTNYGLLVEVSGALNNHAIVATGNITGSQILPTAFADITPAVNTCYIPGDLTNGGFSRILFHAKNSNAGIGLPTRYAVQEALGLASSGKFWFHITIICAADSTQTGYVIGRNSTISGMSGTQYPRRLNNNGGYEQSKFNIAAGDIVEFMLVYDGSEYNAYLLNSRG